MAIANNVDDWANARVGIYFPASSNNTLDDGDLTGQCVSLDKWFLAEMCDVPNPGAARGNAKDFGDMLVAQGLADVVPADQRKRGDLVVWKQDGGGYGHTGALCSNDKVLEQNVGLVGTPSKLVGGLRVYVSRIDPLYAPWRTGSPTFYRVRSYIENVNREGEDMPIPDADNYYGRYSKMMSLIRGRDVKGAGFSREEFRKFFVGQTDLKMEEAMADDPEADEAHQWMSVGYIATRDKWDQQIHALQDQVKALGSRPAPEQLTALQSKIDTLTQSLESTTEQRDALAKQATDDESAGEKFLRVLGQFVSKLNIFK